MTVGPQWIDLSGSIVVTRMAGIGATPPLTRHSGGGQVSRRLRRSPTAAQRSIPDLRHRPRSASDGYAPGLTGIGGSCP
jgi:hypothetical protein